MKTNNLLLIALILILFSCNSKIKKEEVVIIEEVPKEIVETTIYEKLGGAEGVSIIVEEIVEQHINNEHIKHYFIPLKENPEYFNQFKKHVKDFLSSGTGGKEEYKGRDMSSAHKGLNLSEADFLHAIDDILLVLDAHKIDRGSRNEILATLYSMKDSVIKQ